MAIVFLIMSILSIPSVLIFISGNVATGVKELKGLFTKLSLGNVREVLPACGITKLTNEAPGVN